MHLCNMRHHITLSSYNCIQWLAFSLISVLDKMRISRWFCNHRSSVRTPAAFQTSSCILCSTQAIVRNSCSRSSKHERVSIYIILSRLIDVTVIHAALSSLKMVAGGFIRGEWIPRAADLPNLTVSAQWWIQHCIQACPDKGIVLTAVVSCPECRQRTDQLEKDEHISIYSSAKDSSLGERVLGTNYVLLFWVGEHVEHIVCPPTQRNDENLAIKEFTHIKQYYLHRQVKVNQSVL